MDRNKIQALIASMQKGLKESPSGQDVWESEEYLRKLRSGQATLTTAIGQMEAQRSLNLAAIVDQTDENTYKRIKNSSTISMMYSDSSDAELTEMYHTAKELMKLCGQTSDEYRTIISYRKEELKTVPDQ